MYTELIISQNERIKLTRLTIYSHAYLELKNSVVNNEEFILMDEDTIGYF